MIRLALPPEDQARVRFLPVRDYYDQRRWVAAVKRGVSDLLGDTSGKSYVLVGHLKDATSQYLKDFPGWTLDSVESQGKIDATALRDAYFGNAGTSLEPALSAFVSQVPPSTTAFLRTWAALPYFTEMAREWEIIRKMKAAWQDSPYPPVFVTVDGVVQCRGHVLLITRKRSPGKGCYALPGGYLEQADTLYESCLRELDEETSLKLLDDDMNSALKSVNVFDHPGRSQLGRMITHAHHFDLGSRKLPEVMPGDDAETAEWVPIENLAAMEDRFHDDHFHILDFYFSLTK